MMSLQELVFAPPWSLGATSPTLDLLGRLHPLAVHFPIALLVTAAFAEWWRVLRRRERISRTGLACASAGALLGAAAAATGLVNSQTQDHAQGLAEPISIHRISGLVACGIALCAMLLGHAAARRMGRLSGRWYVFALSLAAAAVATAGHLGGSLTYGPEYLLEPLRALGITIPGSTPSGTPARDAGNAPPPEQSIRKLSPSLPSRLAPAGTTLTINYKEVIRPIFEKRCFSCHGPTKRQGRLRLDILADAFSGEPKYWAIKPGNPQQSELVARLGLDVTDKHRMPQRGPSLTNEEVSLISAWISEGAFEGVQGAHAPADVAPMPTPTPPAAAEPAIAPLSAEQELAVRSLRNRFGARVEPLALASPILDVNLSVSGSLSGTTDPRATCEALTLATALSDRVGRLSANCLPLDDGCAPVIAQFTAATTINLGGTGIGDATIAALAPSRSLETLIVYGTKVTNTGIVALLTRCESVKRIYAGRTECVVATLPKGFRHRVVMDASIETTPQPADGEDHPKASQ